MVQCILPLGSDAASHSSDNQRKLTKNELAGGSSSVIKPGLQTPPRQAASDEGSTEDTSVTGSGSGDAGGNGSGSGNSWSDARGKSNIGSGISRDSWSREDVSSESASAMNSVSLLRDGPMDSIGSGGHPDDCKPCAFYCYSFRGCREGSDCVFCHMFHESRLCQRRRSRRMRKNGRTEAARISVEVHPAVEQLANPSSVNAPAFLQTNPKQQLTNVQQHCEWTPSPNMVCGQDQPPKNLGATLPWPTLSSTVAPKLESNAFAGAQSAVADSMPVFVPHSVAPMTTPVAAANHMMLGQPHNELNPRPQVPSPSPKPAVVDNMPAFKAPPAAPMNIPVAAVNQMLDPRPQVPAPAAMALPNPNNGVHGASLPQAALSNVAAVIAAAAQHVAVDLFTYTPDTMVVGTGQTIELHPPVDIMLAGMVFAVAPELPPGISLDRQTGRIYGTAQEATSGPDTYFVTACVPRAANKEVMMAVVSIKIIHVHAPGLTMTSIVQPQPGVTVITLRDGAIDPSCSSQQNQLAETLRMQMASRKRAADLEACYMAQQLAATLHVPKANCDYDHVSALSVLGKLTSTALLAGANSGGSPSL